MKKSEEYLKPYHLVYKDPSDRDSYSPYREGYSDAMDIAGQVIGQAQKEATKVAFKEGQSNPKIKQLEWQDNFKETRWHCDLPIGFYIIDTVRKYEPYRVRFHLSEYDLPKYERYCKTIEEAMMYAQKDFEARIKECLITE